MIFKTYYNHSRGTEPIRRKKYFYWIIDPLYNKYNLFFYLISYKKLLNIFKSFLNL
jgi:hypothetical protein